MYLPKRWALIAAIMTRYPQMAVSPTFNRAVNGLSSLETGALASGLSGKCETLLPPEPRLLTRFADCYGHFIFHLSGATSSKKSTKPDDEFYQATKKMPSFTPSFGDLEYWNKRFTKEESFEWLADFTVLEPWLKQAVAERSGSKERPQVLHIGCGSSALSMQLRDLVESPQQIHNVDYSEVVVEKNRQREHELLSASKASTELCRWSTLDLLSVTQVMEFAELGKGYDVIVDKSTSDAISCSEDVSVELPSRISTNSSSRVSPLIEATVYPLHILAIHIAYLAKPGCVWIVLSYSADRFIYWKDEETIEGLPHPSELWRLEGHEKIEQPPDPNDTVHRPPVMHHLYLLRRTDVRLNRFT
jgi:hypothetical protein